MDNVLTVLREQIKSEATQYNDHLISGGARDFAEYTHATGVIKGLAIAERLLLDLNEKIENS